MTHYHWLIAQVFASWIIVYSANFLRRGTLWVKIFILTYIAYLLLFSISHGNFVVAIGIVAYLILTVLAKRDLFPDLSEIAPAPVLIVTYAISALQLVLVVLSDPGQSVYLVGHNSQYFYQILAVFAAVHIAALVAARVLKLSWVSVGMISLLYFFLINAYVVTPLLLALIVGFLLGKSTTRTSVASTPLFSCLFVANGLLTGFYNSFMGFFTLRGIGSFYNQDDAVLNLATFMFPLLLGQGIMAVRLTRQRDNLAHSED